MADYVNLQQQEYDEIRSSLEKLHEEILGAEASVRSKVLQLTEMEGGFYIANISARVDALLGYLQGGPVNGMKAAFEHTLEAVDTFVETIVQTDVVE